MLLFGGCGRGCLIGVIFIRNSFECFDSGVFLCIVFEMWLWFSEVIFIVFLDCCLLWLFVWFNWSFVIGIVEVEVVEFEVYDCYSWGFLIVKYVFCLVVIVFVYSNDVLFCFLVVVGSGYFRWFSRLWWFLIGLKWCVCLGGWGLVWVNC